VAAPGTPPFAVVVGCFPQDNAHFETHFGTHFGMHFPEFPGRNDLAVVGTYHAIVSIFDVTTSWPIIAIAVYDVVKRLFAEIYQTDNT
jgi:hypothetical protein